MTSTSSPAPLEVRDLRREYPTPGAPLVVLNGISFDLAPGQSMAIMGPSGSGKSTLLQIVGTLDRPSSGTVKLNGADPFGLPPGDLATFRNENVGFVFQEHHLLPQCTVLENVLVPTLVTRAGSSAKEDRAKALIDRVGLTGRLDHRPSELSGGERQRVAIARAMINEPILLLCDEPTGNLDRKTGATVGDLFRQLQAEEKTMFVVATHSAEFAALFDRQFDLIDGRLAPAGK